MLEDEIKALHKRVTALEFEQVKHDLRHRICSAYDVPWKDTEPVWRHGWPTIHYGLEYDFSKFDCERLRRMYAQSQQRFVAWAPKFPIGSYVSSLCGLIYRVQDAGMDYYRLLDENRNTIKVESTTWVDNNYTRYDPPTIAPDKPQCNLSDKYPYGTKVVRDGVAYELRDVFFTYGKRFADGRKAWRIEDDLYTGYITFESIENKMYELYVPKTKFKVDDVCVHNEDKQLLIRIVEIVGNSYRLEIINSRHVKSISNRMLVSIKELDKRYELIA